MTGPYYPLVIAVQQIRPPARNMRDARPGRNHNWLAGALTANHPLSISYASSEASSMNAGGRSSDALRRALGRIVWTV